MPATKFICPDGSRVDIKKCLQRCIHDQRCMFLPTLRAIARSLDRGIKEPTVTELICGVRETYLKKTMEYAVKPYDQLYAIHGSAVHTINEGFTEGNMFSEERLYDDITSGKFDLYGQIIDLNDKSLGDYKVTSSYKLMRALGYYKVDVITGEIYKTGLRKGQMKTRKEWRTDGVRHLLDWAVQLNYYRMLLEHRGFKVERMEIQAMCRDYSLRIATERNIRKPVYMIHINKISDRWIKLYMNSKAKKLNIALKNKLMPEMCTSKERWKNRKCAEYCVVAESCTFGRLVKRQIKAAA
jgi:hypothetical protein